MKIHRFTVLLLILGLSNNVQSAPRLEGTWLSSAERTIQGMESTRELSDEARAAYRGIFGKMKLTFDSKNVIVDFGVPGPSPTITREPYQIEGSGPDYVEVSIGGSKLGIEKIKYFFEDNCIKHLQPGEEWFEYFCKVE